MARTILQRWTDTFLGASNAPDADRDKTSNQVNRVKNTLSDKAIGMNNWTSLNPVQPGRHNQKIALLWDEYLGNGLLGRKSTDAGDIALKADNLDLGDIKVDGATYKDTTAAGTAILNGVAKNNNVRSSGVTDALNAFQTGGFDAFFAGADKVEDIKVFVKNNYRMAAANPNGTFSSFTAHALTDTSNQAGQLLATTKLDTLAPTQ